MAAGGPVTAEDLGLAGDDLWQFVSPRHVVLNLQPAGANPWFADAVLLVGSADGIVACVPHAAAPGEPQVMVQAQSDDLLDDLGSDDYLACAFIFLAEGDYAEHVETVPPLALRVPFGEQGQVPAIGSALIKAPVELFPDWLSQAIHALAAGEVDEAEFAAETPAWVPLGPGELVHTCSSGLLFGDPSADTPGVPPPAPPPVSAPPTHAFNAPSVRMGGAAPPGAR